MNEEHEQKEQYFSNLSKQNQSLSSKFQEMVHYQTELDNEESVFRKKIYILFTIYLENKHVCLLCTLLKFFLDLLKRIEI